MAPRHYLSSMPPRTRLPLFPLDAVLFPGAVLPLHIFEPRYREMVADCLAGDRQFGILPDPGSGRPDTGTVGCRAEIRDAQRLPDGRSNIIVVGRRRFMVRRYVPEHHAYLVALIDEFDDEPGTEPEPGEVRALRALYQRHTDLTRLLDATEAAEDPGADAMAEVDIESPAGVVDLSFRVAATLHTGPLKRRLLETRSTDERVRLLLQLLPALIGTAELAAVVHTRARSNGKGGHGGGSDSP
jgi:Lon protease-like protein